jgi:hypothetical protein
VLGALTVPVENNQQMQFVGPDGQMIQVVVDQEPQNPEPPPVLGSVLKLGFMSLIIVELQKLTFFLNFLFLDAKIITIRHAWVEVGAINVRN